MLTAPVAPAPLRNAGDTGVDLQVEEYDGVGRGEANRQDARVVALDEPAWSGDETFLDDLEFFGWERVPVGVVVDGVEVGRRESEWPAGKGAESFPVANSRTRFCRRTTGEPYEVRPTANRTHVRL